MAERAPVESVRRDELLDRAYAFCLEHGVSGLSLRPLAAAIGSSPRVLLFLFGSKEALVRALLARARADELARLAALRAGGRSDDPGGLAATVRAVWGWLAAPEHRSLLRLWAEAYGQSLVQPDGLWVGFASATVADWLALLADAQPVAVRDTPAALAERTLALAVLRGALLDLLATGEVDRLTAAVELSLSR